MELSKQMYWCSVLLGGMIITVFFLNRILQNRGGDVEEERNESAGIAETSSSFKQQSTKSAQENDERSVQFYNSRNFADLCAD